MNEPRTPPPAAAQVLDYDHEEIECKRKKIYTKKLDAVRAACNLRKKMETKRIDAYRCRFCPHWHVGHTPWYKEPQ